MHFVADYHLEGEILEPDESVISSSADPVRMTEVFDLPQSLPLLNLKSVT